MRGGIRIASDFPNKTPDAAFNFFMENLAECLILTDYSVSCVTFICSLNSMVSSPYQSMRSTNFNMPVKKIILKIFLYGEESKSSDKSSKRTKYVEMPTREYLKKIDEGQTIESEKEHSKELTSRATILNEIKLQQTLYNASFINKLTPCEPMCPAIITYQINISLTEQQFLFKYMTKPNVFKKTTEYDLEMVTALFTNPISFIAMELLENCMALHDIKTHPIYGKDYENYMLIAAWEFARLCKIFGIAHNDAHSNNIMIDPTDKNYFGGGVMGRAIIIDFGRSEMNIPIQSQMKTRLNTTMKQKPNTLWKRIFTNKRKTKSKTKSKSTELSVANDLLLYPLNKSINYAEALSCGNKTKWGDRSFLKLIMKIKDINSIKPFILAHPQNLTTKYAKNKSGIAKVQNINTEEKILIDEWSYSIDFLHYLTRSRFKVAKQFLMNFSKTYKMTFQEAYQSLIASQHTSLRGGMSVADTSVSDTVADTVSVADTSSQAQVKNVLNKELFNQIQPLGENNKQTTQKTQKKTKTKPQNNDLKIKIKHI